MDRSFGFEMRFPPEQLPEHGTVGLLGQKLLARESKVETSENHRDADALEERGESRFFVRTRKVARFEKIDALSRGVGLNLKRIRMIGCLSFYVF